MLNLLIATVFLALLLALIYLKEKIGQSRLFHTNFDYLILGFLLAAVIHSADGTNPEMNTETWVSVATLLYGIVFGARFNFRNFLDKTSDEWKMVYFPLLAGAVLIGLLWLCLMIWDLTISTNWMVVCIGAVLIMLSNSREIVSLLIRKQITAPAELVKQFNVITVSMDVILIGVFGLWIAYLVPEAGVETGLRPLEWIVVNILLGVGGGAIAVLMLGKTPNDHKLAIVLSSHVLVLAVSTIYLQFSPLFTGMLWSSIILNFYRNSEHYTTFLYRFEKPIFAFVYVAAGYMVSPGTVLYALPLSLLYLIIRFGLKYVPARQAFYVSENPVYWTDSIGLMLTAQGVLALALSINLVSILGTPEAHLLHTVVVFGVLLFQIISMRVIRTYLQTYVLR